MIGLLIFTLTLSGAAQPNWSSQPKWLGLGFAFGLFNEQRLPYSQVLFRVGLGRIAWDVTNKNTPEPFAPVLGAYISRNLKIQLKKRAVAGNK